MRTHVSKVLIGTSLANVFATSVALEALTEGQIIAFDFDTQLGLVAASKNIGFARGTAVLGEPIVAGPIPKAGISSAILNPYQAAQKKKVTLTVSAVPTAGKTVIFKVVYHDNLSLIPNQMKQTVVTVTANAASTTTTIATAIAAAFNAQEFKYVTVTSAVNVVTFEAITLLTASAYNGIDRPENVNFEVGAPDATTPELGTYTVATLSLTTPVNATFTSGAGTLGIATYFYRVSAINASGETLASAETSLALGGPGGVNVNWVAVAGATGYKIYGRTTGAQLLIATVGVVTTYLDGGSITPAGALPTANTTSIAGKLGQGDPAKMAWLEDQAMGRRGYSDRRSWNNNRKYDNQVVAGQTYATLVINADIDVEGDMQNLRHNPIGVIIGGSGGTVALTLVDLATAGVVPETVAAS